MEKKQKAFQVGILGAGNIAGSMAKALNGLAKAGEIVPWAVASRSRKALQKNGILKGLMEAMKSMQRIPNVLELQEHHTKNTRYNSCRTGCLYLVLLRRTFTSSALPAS